MADVGKQAGMHLLSPLRARLGSRASAHLGCCFPCSADLLPHHWLCSASWAREKGHVVTGLLSLAYTQLGLCLALG